MFSWLSGAKAVEIEDEIAAPEPTIIEPPQTPAPLFAYRALKHAVWGTPSATDNSASPNKKDKSTGILMTPGTAGTRRKQVTFGAQVVDNETNKKPSRSGLPSNCPGKFPSPFTPRVVVGKGDARKKARARERKRDVRERVKKANGELAGEGEEETEESSGDEEETEAPDADAASEKGSDKSSEKGSEKGSEKADKKRVLQRRSKSSSSTTSPTDTTAASFISITDIPGDPNTAAYWKARYEAYAAKSEQEMRRLVKKTKLAKQFAKDKDAECNALTTKLDDERKRHKSREHELAAQMKDYKERLRLQLAESGKLAAENAGLKKKLAESTSAADAAASRRRARSRSRASRKSASPEKKSVSATSSPVVDIWEDQGSPSSDDDENESDRETVVTAVTNRSDEPKENNTGATPKSKGSSTKGSERSSRKKDASPKERFPPNRLTLARAKMEEKKAQRARMKENGRPLR